jgi:hypothetical protein
MERMGSFRPWCVSAVCGVCTTTLEHHHVGQMLDERMVKSLPTVHPADGASLFGPLRVSCFAHSTKIERRWRAETRQMDHFSIPTSRTSVSLFCWHDYQEWSGLTPTCSGGSIGIVVAGRTGFEKCPLFSARAWRTTTVGMPLVNLVHQNGAPSSCDGEDRPS